MVLLHFSWKHLEYKEYSVWVLLTSHPARKDWLKLLEMIIQRVGTTDLRWTTWPPETGTPTQAQCLAHMRVFPKVYEVSLINSFVPSFILSYSFPCIIFFFLFFFSQKGCCNWIHHSLPPLLNNWGLIFYFLVLPTLMIQKPLFVCVCPVWSQQ